MTAGRDIAVLAFLGLVLSGTGYADMTAFDRLEANQPAGFHGQPDAEGSPVSDPLFGSTFATAPGVPDKSWLRPMAVAGPTHDAQPIHVLTEGHYEFHLCLWALLGFGLCESAPWMKRLSVGVIPEWYHGGGPFQIGHSSAIPPDCLISVPVFCFVQPDCTGEHSSPRHTGQSFIAPWPISKCALAVDAPRGPPFHS